MPDLPEPTPRSSTRSSGDFDRDLSPGPTRPLSRLQRLASMDLSKQPEDAAVAHRFRQPLVVNGRPLSLPKVNDTIWQALNRVEQEWLGSSRLIARCFGGSREAVEARQTVVAVHDWQRDVCDFDDGDDSSQSPVWKR